MMGSMTIEELFPPKYFDLMHYLLVDIYIIAMMHIAAIKIIKKISTIPFI